ncbi:MAG: NAD(P)-dependent oxidoreductase [Cyclobacteriaceae bacterium]
MKKVTLGILREGKIPVDHRVPFDPAQAAAIQKDYPGVEVLCERSEIRCFEDEEYSNAGIIVSEDINACDILFGVKEVPADLLIDGKTYFFFSHTIKAQPYNRDLLREILRKKITLIDYEVLRDTSGKRLVAFGRYAGIVGAYNGIRTYGQRYGLYDLRRASDCFDLNELKEEYSKIDLPAIRIALTGSGRVAYGAMEVLSEMGISKVTPEEYLSGSFDKPVYTQLRSLDYNRRQDGQSLGSKDFYENPGEYTSDFGKYAGKTDLLLACAYWNPEAPVLFSKEDTRKDDFKIKVIADITCDIEGSIPTTKRPSTIDNPVYDYDPATYSIRPPYSSQEHISVMAVDNLPCELPRDASEDFGHDLSQYILPHLFGGDKDGIIAGATICKDGQLTPEYAYLQDFVNGEDNVESIVVSTSK